ncbi:4649_t:CDS:2 [Ambispora gerdemannii]|uniref:4649_t:CDS:1 n=1 Tax=Ambispora gerdemannii TaxID=144530 RepID=A0A9N9A9K9_9GLOM|nr:4649_t:CDS:2 [Ambispora gerdemannii]
MPNSVVNANYDYLHDNELVLLSKCSYQLTLSIEELTKPAVRKRDNSDKPPRPQNSWIIFRRDYEAHLRLCNQHIKQKVKETAKECSLKWRELSSETKHFFKILEKIACENHKSLYPNYKYKPKNAKDSSVKKWVFREQKKYAPKLSHKPSSTSTTPQEAAQIVRSPSLNNTTSTIEYNHTVITASTTIDDTCPSTVNNNTASTTIDDTCPSTVNNNNADVGNSINNAFNEIISLDQFSLLSGNVGINVNNDTHPSTINPNANTWNSINMVSRDMRKKFVDVFGDEFLDA